MAYCSKCGQPVEEKDRYCPACGRFLATGGQDAAAKASPQGLDDVPWWLGWLAVPIGVLTPIVGFGLYCYWAYRRGRRDGMNRSPTHEPFQNFGWRVAGWGLLASTLFMWYAIVHLPTLCYKHGHRLGAKEGTAYEGFTSLPALGGAFGAIVVTALAALFIAGATLAIVDGDEPIRVVPRETVPTPAPNFTMFDAMSLTQREVAEGSFFPGDTKWVRCTSASWRSGNRVWLVTCEFFVNRDDRLADQTRQYIFNDGTGHVEW